MNQSKLCTAVVCFLFFAGLHPLGAQSSGPEMLRNGPYFGVGIGAGNAWIDCSTCGGVEREEWQGGLTPLTFTIDLGWSLRPDLLLGAELDMWGESKYANPSETRGLDLTFLGAVIQYYPFALSGIYLKGGLGLGRLRMHDGQDEILDKGGAVLAGFGYDLRIKRSLSVTPYFHAIQWQIEGAAGQIRNVAMQSPQNPRVLHGGVAFRYY